jgi:hypothetical protein
MPLTPSGPGYVTTLRVNATGVAPAFGGISAPAMQLAGTDGNSATFGASRFSGNTGSPNIVMGKSRGTTVGDFAAVQSGDLLSQYIVQGADGSAFGTAAQIQCYASENYTSTARGAYFRVFVNPIGSTTASAVCDFVSGGINPSADNARSLGTASFRFSQLFAATGTINTSDAREKTAVRPFSDAEIGAAKALANEIGAFQWLAAVEEKGDDARLHIGMTVQRAMEIMEGFGLDPFRYGFICRDEWEAEPEICSPVIGQRQVMYRDIPVLDETGEPLWEDYDTGETVVTQAAREAGYRLGFRETQLAFFIQRGFAARLAALENAA